MAYVPLTQIARGLGRIMSQHGEAMLLKRTGAADLNLPGKRLMKARASGADEFSNSATAQDLVVQIGNAEILAAAWPGPPAAGDIVALADDSKEWAISKVDTRVDAGVVLCHFLYVVGTD
jgi:hypothetical protein